MKKKTKILISSAAVALVAAMMVGGILLGQKYYDRKVPNFGKVAEIYVYPETSADSLEAMVLRKSQVLKPRSLHRAFQELTIIQPGHYTITRDNTSMYVARMFSHGWQTPVNLVLSGSMRRPSAIAQKISRQMLVDSVQVMEALRDTVLLDSLGFEPDQYFALFIPDTYQMKWTDSIEQIMKRLKKEYDAFWTAENLAKAQAQGLSPKEVSILASIVNGETNHQPEMPEIAGVYLNRLHRNMKLQADPTVAYCFDYQLNRILKVHTRVDSPFNTYKYAGLPPAPICVPSKSALHAVLNPDRNGYLYFCASPEMNGTHLFAASYAEHLRNARAFHRALTQRLKERKAAAAAAAE